LTFSAGVFTFSALLDLWRHGFSNRGSIPGVGEPEKIKTRLRASGKRLSFSTNQEEPQMNLKPLHDRVVIKRLEEETLSKGGIIIPDTAKKKPAQGEVMAVGDGKVLENGTKTAMNVKVGDKVLFSTYAGNDVKIGGEEYLIMREEEILGIIE